MGKAKEALHWKANQLQEPNQEVRLLWYDIDEREEALGDLRFNDRRQMGAWLGPHINES